MNKKFKAINKRTGKEYEVLDIHDYDRRDEIDVTIILIKKSKNSKPTWHTLASYNIEEVKFKNC